MSQASKAETFGQKCGFYKCWTVKGESGYCDEHNNTEDIGNMREFKGFREEGHSTYSAALMAGLIDPDEDE